MQKHRLRRRWAVGGVLTLASLIAACGGGGGGGSGGAAPVVEQPQGNTPDTGASTGPALTLGPDSFHFKPDLSLVQSGALDNLAGGQQLAAAWNPTDARIALSPGMKVLFFGQSEHCAFPAQGPVDSFDDERLADLAQLTAIGVASLTNSVRWAPSGRSSHCHAAAQTRVGNAAAYLAADATRGGVGILTTTGEDAAGRAPFFRQFSAGGQDGRGNNAFLQVSVVGFRQNVDQADPVQPWLGTGKARVRSEQALGSARVDGSSAPLVQAKQQIGLSFLNRRCYAETAAGSRPCQIQYIFTTAIFRSGVADWSQVDWFKNANLIHDPVQGGIPVVDGPLFASGTTTKDAKHGLAVWTSQGSATQHSTFSGRTFDASISFDQLLNALRLTVANANQLPPDQVTDDQMQAFWGSGWRDSAQWVLLSSDIGQEVFNPDLAFRAELGGGFRDLFVGPQ